MEFEQKLILHSYRRCPFAIRVRLVLEEKNLPYEVVEENLSALSETILKFHPEGRVPLLIHGGNFLPESAVITEYLDDVFPQRPVRPTDPWGRAQVRLWTRFCDDVFKPDLDVYKYEFEKLSEPEQAALLKRINCHFLRFEAALANHEYLLGNEFTLADIHVFPFIRQIQKAHRDFAKHFQLARLQRWYEAISQRESFVRVMEKNSGPRPGR